MTSFRVSVVIPFYGNPAPVLELISQLRSSRCASLHEVIVSDDTSPTPFPDTPGVTVVRRKINGGFARAVNSGAAVATGDLLLILNSDLHLNPGMIDALVQRAVPWMPACVTVPLFSHGAPSFPGRHFPHLNHYVAEWLLPLVRFRCLAAVHEAVGHDMLANPFHDEVCDWIVGAFMLMPLPVFRALGGLDEFFYMNCEEVDLQLRLRRLGVPSVTLGIGENTEGVPTDDLLYVEHEGGGSSDPSHPLRRIAWVMDGRKRYAYKHTGMLGVRRFEIVMLTATGVNFAWNTLRRLRHSDLRPIDTARNQAALILHPEQWVPGKLRFNPYRDRNTL